MKYKEKFTDCHMFTQDLNSSSQQDASVNFFWNLLVMCW